MDAEKWLEKLPKEWKNEGRAVKQLHLLSQQNEAAMVLSRAYRSNPVFKDMLPQIEDRRVGLFNNFLAVLNQESVGLLVTIVGDDTADDAGDAIRGVAIWKVPKAYISWKSSMSLTYAITKAFGLSAKIYDYFKIQEHIDAIKTEYEKKHKVGCWSLEIMGTDPTCQRKGYGISLLKPVLEEVDKENCSVFLGVTNAENIPFFKKLGFEVVRQFEYDGHRVSCMFRPPQEPVAGEAVPAEVAPAQTTVNDGLDNRLLEDGPLPSSSLLL